MKFKYQKQHPVKAECQPKKAEREANELLSRFPRPLTDDEFNSKLPAAQKTKLNKLKEELEKELNAGAGTST